jgi:hypothetical protein
MNVERAASPPIPRDRSAAHVGAKPTARLDAPAADPGSHVGIIRAHGRELPALTAPVLCQRALQCRCFALTLLYA